VTAFALADDVSLGEDVVDDPKADLKAYKDAKAEFKTKKQAFAVAKANFLKSSAAVEFQAADAKLMQSMEALLEVPAADTAMLTKAVGGTLGKDALVAFYAPWCPHCKTFVLHDKKGNPRNAPLENLRKDMAKDAKLKGVEVYRADVTVLGQNGIPAKLVVQGIPTMYFISAKGTPTQYKGHPHDFASIKAFAEKLASA